jgi:hypothetical protein
LENIATEESFVAVYREGDDCFDVVHGSVNKLSLKRTVVRTFA